MQFLLESIKGLSAESILNILVPTVTALVVFGLTILSYYLKDSKIAKSLRKALEREIYHNVYEIVHLKAAAEFINADPLAQSDDWSPITSLLKYNKPTFWAFEAIIKEANVSSLGGDVAEIFSFYYMLKEYDNLLRNKIGEIEDAYHRCNAKQRNSGIFSHILSEKINRLNWWCQEIIDTFEKKLLIEMPFLSRNNWEAFKKEKNIK